MATIIDLKLHALHHLIHLLKPGLQFLKLLIFLVQSTFQMFHATLVIIVFLQMLPFHLIAAVLAIHTQLLALAVVLVHVLAHKSDFAAMTLHLEVRAVV